MWARFGYHGLLSIDPNTIPAPVCSNPAGCTAGGVGSFTSTVGQGTQYIPVQKRPNPQSRAGILLVHRGQQQLQRAASGCPASLQPRAAVSRQLHLVEEPGYEFGTHRRARPTTSRKWSWIGTIPSRDWGPSALNAAHQASLSGSYELPFGRGKRWLAGARGFEDKLVGGWQLNAIATLLSGFPFTPEIGSNRSGDGDTRNPDRPSLNPAFSGPVTLGSPNQWFNPNAFVRPAAGTWGNLGRGVLTGPGLADLDASLFKDVSLTEQFRLQFRAEFFNALNHTNLGAPNAITFSGINISPSAGLITSTATTSRQIQFGLKLIF